MAFQDSISGKMTVLPKITIDRPFSTDQTLPTPATSPRVFRKPPGVASPRLNPVLRKKTRLDFPYKYTPSPVVRQEI